MPTACRPRREPRTTPGGRYGRAMSPTGRSGASPRPSTRASAYAIWLIVTRRPENSYFAPNSRGGRPSMSATRRALRTDADPRPARTSTRPCT